LRRVAHARGCAFAHEVACRGIDQFDARDIDGDGIERSLQTTANPASAKKAALDAWSSADLEE